MRSLALLSTLLAATASAQPGALSQLREIAPADAEVVIRVPLGRPQGPVNHALPRRLQGRDDGREAAAQFCGTAAFDSDKQECLRVVTRSYYFEAKALSVCRKVNFSGEVPGCVSAIADKTFLQAEADLCNLEHFGSGIISCFQSSGRPTRGGGGDGYTRRQLRRIRSLMRDGRYRDAERELDELIDSLED